MEFYRLYKENRYDVAERHLLKNDKLKQSHPDIHQAYKHLKSSDNQALWTLFFIVVVIAVVIYIIVK